ncbi:MAG: hypothetical protein L0Y57_03270 [Beijerinckiaceae bacterium]|nr:hypothetical protein [Beijerinckiaceae bacterium]MCI0601038.1 hypothetical protein [Beijerinckiaceae bacterium]MCI0735024.1 hypothetical protein [Beijerinckiaceae bacterium]
MAKQLTKSAFGSPSPETLANIDAPDKGAELQAAGYRFRAKLAEPDRQFKAKASNLRAATHDVRVRGLPKHWRKGAPAGAGPGIAAA